FFWRHPGSLATARGPQSGLTRHEPPRWRYTPRCMSHRRATAICLTASVIASVCSACSTPSEEPGPQDDTSAPATTEGDGTSTNAGDTIGATSSHVNGSTGVGSSSGSTSHSSSEEATSTEPAATSTETTSASTTTASTTLSSAV